MRLLKSAHFSLTLAVATSWSAMSLAQSESEPGRERPLQQKSEQAGKRSQQVDSGSNRSANPSNPQSQRRDPATASLRVQPDGWVRVGLDYDNDGWFDAVETIYYYDLEQAQQRSRQRTSSDARASGEVSQDDEIQGGRPEEAATEESPAEDRDARLSAD